MGPEHKFIAAIEHVLPPRSAFHREKNWNALRSGTADYWYSGSFADLWVEYKWFKLPRIQGQVVNIYDLLSPIQRRWLDGRWAEGRSIAMIAGYERTGRKRGIVFINGAWNVGYPSFELEARSYPPRELASWLEDRCRVGSFDHSVKPIGALDSSFSLC